MATEVKRSQTRLSSKHQVTIPIRLVREAGLRPGDNLIVQVEGSGRLRLIRIQDIFDEYAGKLNGIYAPGWLDELRDEWE